MKKLKALLPEAIAGMWDARRQSPFLSVDDWQKKWAVRENHEEIIEIKIDGYSWFIQKIDSTHLYLANNRRAIEGNYAMASHVAEFKDRPFYENLRKWLHGQLPGNKITENTLITEGRPIKQIAKEIYNDWDDINKKANQYLKAMLTLENMGEEYGADTAASIVGYFLSSSRDWYGPKAKKIKTELNSMLNKYYNSSLTEAHEIPSELLYGKSKEQAKKILYKMLDHLTKGIFRDEYWQPIHAIWKTLEKNGIEVDLEKSEYGPPGQFPPQNKVWYFTIPFVNQRQKEDKLHGNITAAGAGSVEDPLGRYDVTLVIS